MTPVLLAIILLAGPALAQGRKSKEGWTDLLPPGNGRELVLESCTTCHNLRVVAQARLSREAWTKDVNDMIQRGAPVFPEEIEPIINYLSKAFGPGVPKLVNVNTASREELEKLPNLKPQIVTRILDARTKAGVFKNSEELRKALGMEKGDFDTILYLLKYSE
jgi:helix-hairpin-helix protein